jgi:cytochrome c553
MAYVPRGSLAKGEAFATTGAAQIVGAKVVPGKTAACTACHGADLNGLGDIPPIAGRSPSYLVRQLVDTQKGNRRGEGVVLMQPVVANLTMSDIVAIAAYVSSRPPASASKTATTAQRWGTSKLTN